MFVKVEKRTRAQHTTCSYRSFLDRNGRQEGALTIRRAFQSLGNLHIVYNIRLDAVATSLNLQGASQP